MDENAIKSIDEMDSLLRMIGQKYQQLFVPKQSELSAHQIYFLKYLQRRNVCTPSEISLEFGITLGAVTGFIDRLNKIGLVDRTRSESDRRLVLIELTEQGKSLLLQLESQRKEQYALLIKQLGIDGIRELNTHLSKLKSALGD